MSDAEVRVRAEQFLTLAHTTTDDDDVAHLLDEGVWAARALLVALDTIDSLRSENEVAKNLHQQYGSGYCTSCDGTVGYPCPTRKALNGDSDVDRNQSHRSVLRSDEKTGPATIQTSGEAL